MLFRTTVDIPTPSWNIEPAERLLCVGSCFADRIGERFAQEQFPTIVNPFGVMYNPASVWHTIQKTGNNLFDVCIITLGTNHIYRLKETGEIVDNCQKRPARLFQEELLSVEACADYLEKSIDLLRQANPAIKILLTVSPIRYQKYGFHGSQLSKATLLLAIDHVIGRLQTLKRNPCHQAPEYFPAYEIVNDELRDYRFYREDMLHPSDQTVEYIWQRLVENRFSSAAIQFLKDWKPIKQAHAHKPFNPESLEYQQFKQQTAERLAEFRKKYHLSE